MTSVPHPQAGEDGRSQGFTLRERAAYPQLGWFHLLTRWMVLGTHPTKPHLRRSWFAPSERPCGRLSRRGAGPSDPICHCTRRPNAGQTTVVLEFVALTW